MTALRRFGGLAARDCDKFVTYLLQLSFLCYVQGVNALLFMIPLGVAIVFAYLMLRDELR